jgi:hypothetical protein
MAGAWADEKSTNGGLLRLAGKFGVGIMCKHNWNGLSMYVGPDYLWSQQRGPRGNAATWRGGEKVGNQG